MLYFPVTALVSLLVVYQGQYKVFLVSKQECPALELQLKQEDYKVVTACLTTPPATNNKDSHNVNSIRNGF